MDFQQVDLNTKQASKYSLCLQGFTMIYAVQPQQPPQHP